MSLGLRLGGACAALALILAPHSANAFSFRSDEKVIVGQNEVIEDTLVVAGRSVQINGAINGDIICAGETVEVNATVRGDVICAADTLTINGSVDGNIRSAGRLITNNATVSRNALLAGGEVTTGEKSNIAGDALIAGEILRLSGAFGRDLALGASTGTVTATIGRGTFAKIGQLTYHAKTVAPGGVVAISPNAPKVEAGAQVGTITHHQPDPKKKSDENPLPQLIFMLYMFMALLITSLALALIAPGLFKVSAISAQQAIGWTALTGIAVLALVPVTVLILLVSIIGLPLGLLGIMIFGLLLVLSGPTFSYFIGHVVLHGKSNAFLTMLLGSSIVLICYAIPLVNIITLLAAGVFGSGMIARQFFMKGQTKF